MQYFQESESIIINQITEKINEDIFFIVGFKKTIILINQSLISSIIPFFQTNQNATIYLLGDTKDIFNITIQNTLIQCDLILQSEINEFNKLFDQLFQQIDHSIRSCISGYLRKHESLIHLYIIYIMNKKLNFVQIHLLYFHLLCI